MSSTKETAIVLNAPDSIDMLPPREAFVSTGHVCNYCHGEGWKLDMGERESRKKVCPVCKGSGFVTAVVTVTWEADKRGQ
jgi:excinuclease UvrABC ATPase subunit